MNVIWIASYPKSGNTLVRMLLHNYLFGRTHDTNVTAERIPDLHSLLARNIQLEVKIDKPQFVKTHFCFSNQHPYAGITSGFIYILRNPRDVLLSNARYLGVTSSIEKLRSFAHTFIDELGVPVWRQDNMGTWPEHVASWLQLTSKVPHIFIKYEDMMADTFNTLKRLISFIGLEPVDSKLQMAVASCEIGKARKHEAEEKKHGRTKIYNQMPNNENFVGEGKTGQSLTGIGEDIERLYKERFGKFINLFNYE